MSDTIYSKDTLLKACKKVLVEHSVKGMLNCNVPLEMICNIAANAFFKHGDCNCAEANVIRQALIDFDKNKSFNFTNVEEKLLDT